MSKKPYTVDRFDGNGPIQAKTYVISKADIPDDLEKCWSACNGVDGFGNVEKDYDLNRARQKYGECLEKLPCCPRLILYRRRKSTALEAKLWTTRTFDGADDPYLLLASIAKAMVAVGSDAAFLSIELVDWAPDKSRSEDCEGRHELSIEVCGPYGNFYALQCLHKKFHKIFDKGNWK